MGRSWRWGVVALVTAVLAALPLAAHLLPVGNSSISARALLARIRASSSVAYTGYAQSIGGVSLPVSNDQFSAISDLFGSTKQLRVWWRGSDDYRVDTIDATGETDLHQDSTGTWTWDYESDSAQRYTQSSTPTVRLPRSDDLVPANLARRLLSEADPADVSRLPSARIAGRSAAGLRLTITDPDSTISHVDVWALPSDGLPVKVSVYGDKTPRPVVSTSFLDLDVGVPPVSTVSFHPAASDRVDDGQFADIVDAIDQFGQSRPPNSIAGLRRRTDLNLGAVGVYGRGVTLLVAVPLDSNLAGQIVPSLRKTPGEVEDTRGISVSAGALNIQLGPPSGFGQRWLLVGTVRRKTLRSAVSGLPPIVGFGFHR
jgi:hypothetical protein